MSGWMLRSAGLGEMALRLLVAAALGGFIGLNRERFDKPAGLRTHMLVAIGAATFILLAFDMGAHLPSETGARFDPTRVLQGVITGVGFLGAGAILRDRGQVSGITTAASVWVAGGLGTAAGVGAYALGTIAALLSFAILSVLGRFEGALRDSAHGRD